jgi:DNA polymerase I-like protein with 3'-5' exonuclease and polymerase domains
MGKDEAKKLYKHFVPPVRVVPEWHKHFKFTLVENLEQLYLSFQGFIAGQTLMSFDTETSGLDPENSSIVGFSYSLDGSSAYYVAVNHYLGKFNLGEVALDFIYERMCEAKKVFMFNARFDIRMMEYWGYDKRIHLGRFMYVKYDMSKVPYYDVAVPVWLADTNVKMPSLKDSVLHFLGYKMQTYAEVSDGAENFYYINPADCFFYASADALCTYQLAEKTIKYYQEAGFISKVDIRVLYPLMHYEQEKTYLDTSILSTLVRSCLERLETLERTVYNSVGYIFKLNSPAQVSDAFSGLGIDTGSKTKTGYMKTGIDELEALPESIKKQHPALASFIEYKTLYKFMSSYAKVLLEISQEKGFVRCSYKTTQVPTGRLASGKDTKNTFFSEYNVQSSPKPHPLFYYVLDLGDRNLCRKKDNIIMGYQFVPVQYRKNDETGKQEQIDGKELYPNYMFVAEGADTKMNIRSAFLPVLDRESNEDEWVWCSIDFSGQELRLAANFSQEPVWVDAFRSGGDIHRSTAYSIWGEENYDKEKRKMAKGANFAIIYGAEAMSFIGEGKTAEKPDGMSEDEAQEFFAKYKQGLPTLFKYQERLIRRSRSDGTVRTFFGRPRRVKFYFENRQIGFGKRTILNSPIQGSAGDVLKIVMCQLWQGVLNAPEYKDDVMFKITVHDEINYGIRVNRLNEIARKLENTMTFDVVEWSVPLTVEVSLGWSWGMTFAFEWDSNKGHYVPKKA